MELDITNGKVFCCGAAEERKATLPVDCSIILPDYFPDVMKILRYTAKTVKSPVFPENGGVNVSGNINIEVSYVSEEGELCSCSQLQGFGHSFDCGEVAAASAEITVGEIGCRAVNKRRIDLHGSIDIVLRTLSGEEKAFVSDISGSGAVCKKESTETVLPVGEYYKSFSIDEKGELGYQKPPFGRVLQCEAFAEVTECHVIQDKIVTKGEAKVSLLWQPAPESGEDATPIHSSFTFPISRMLDAEGILLTDICDARYEAEFPEISPIDDMNVGVKLKIGIFARVYRTGTAEYITDMFSTDCESKAEKGKLSVLSEAVPVSVTETIYEKFDLPEGTEDIIHIWVEPSSPDFNAEGKICLPVKLCLFARDGDNSPIYFEKELLKEVPAPLSGKAPTFWDFSYGVKSCEYSFEHGGKAEISAAVLIDGTVYTGLSTEAITSCNLSTDKKLEQSSAAIILCYAEKGEALWDIAKKYRAKPQDIMQENSLDREILPEKTMLVIPR